MTHRGFVAVCGAAVGLVVATTVVVITVDPPHPPSALAVPAGPALSIVAASAWLAAGLVAWRRRPANRVGVMTVAVGGAILLPWLLVGLGPLGFTMAVLADDLPHLLGAYLFLIFPTGRLVGRAARVIIALACVVAGPMQGAEVLFRDYAAAGCDTCSANLLLIDANAGMADAIVTTARVVAVGLAIALVIVQGRRWHAASAPARLAYTPGLWATVVALVLFAVTWATQSPDEDEKLALIPMLGVALIPVAIVVGLLRTQLQRTAVGDLVIELAAPRSLIQLRDLLARALGDPSLELVVWLSEAGCYIDPGGRPVAVPRPDATRALSVIDHDGVPLAALLHDPSLRHEPELVDSVSAAARLALQNSRLEAELRAQLLIVRDSRARIVAAGDAERRRIERNLHDGAQQRLLAIRLALRLARRTAASGPEALDNALAEIDAEIAGALDELRALARGLHPPILTEEGLGPALDALARRAAIPVTFASVPVERMPPAVETATYYVAAEGLANVVRHADASHVRIAVSRTNGRVIIEVADDGRGGADVQGGGLSGLRDRVEALDGTLTISSSPERGTTLRAELPCA